MSYFNNAYRKTFLATKPTQAGDGSHKAVDNGFLTADGIHTVHLKDTTSPYNLGVGVIGFFDPKTNLSVAVADSPATTGAPLYLAAASLHSVDKIGQFHGGYSESNKSKVINPRFVHKFLKVTGGAPLQAISHVGNTNINYLSTVSNQVLTTSTILTDGVYTGVPVVNGSGSAGVATVTVVSHNVTSVVLTAFTNRYKSGDSIQLQTSTGASANHITADAAGHVTVTLSGACDYTFQCGQTYTLRVDLKGSPVLRVLNHAAYRELAAYTGCCPDGASTGAVDSTLVMLDWANQMINDPYLQGFIQPTVYDQNGTPWFATPAAAVAAGYTGTAAGSTVPGSANTFDQYVSPGVLTEVLGGVTVNKLAGIRVVGAYADNTFEIHSFQNSDFFQKETVKIHLSLVDLQGNPCTFDGLCVSDEYEGYGGEGYGDTFLKNLILDESYLTNHFHSDIRLREVNLGLDLLGALNRTSFYDVYVLLHTVPRYNNPSGVFDNDQYQLEIVVPHGTTATAFEAFMSTWLAAAGNTISLDTIGHTTFTPAVL